MTEKHTESGTKLVTGHKRDGRCIYSKQGKRELAQACLRPGVSVAGTALRFGVNANLLRKWIRAYQAGGQGKLPVPPAAKPDHTPRLVPVIQARHPMAERIDDGVPKHVTAEPCIEIVASAFTVRLRGAVDLRQLSVVLDCLAQDR